MAATYENTALRRLVNRLVAPAARLGVAGKRTHILTVAGRKTGRTYSTPVQLVFEGGQRWLVSPYGDRASGWVRNARAAGTVELTRALHTERVRIEEVDAQTAAPILREYLRKTPITKPYFDASADSPLEEFAAEAARHPVFRIASS
jgi:deazaflavin-dependent oxidoreductase (nitroreductase family)